MWSEYTRETPARSALTLFTAALALGLSTGLAYFMTHSRGAQSVSIQTVDIPRGWPIRFDVPEGFRFGGAGDSWQDVFATDASAGSIVFFRVDPRVGLLFADSGLRVVLLTVRFRYRDDAVPPDRRRGQGLAPIFRELTGLTPDTAELVAMGPLDGLMGVGTVHPTGSRYVAVAKDDCGLVLHLEMELAEDTPRDRAAFEAVCESITYQDWFVRTDPTSGPS